MELERGFKNCQRDKVPPHFNSPTEDAGNGSLMRLAPVRTTAREGVAACCACSVGPCKCMDSSRTARAWTLRPARYRISNYTFRKAAKSDFRTTRAVKAYLEFLVNLRTARCRFFFMPRAPIPRRYRSDTDATCSKLAARRTSPPSRPTLGRWQQVRDLPCNIRRKCV